MIGTMKKLFKDRAFLVFVCCAGGILVLFFLSSFRPGYVVFSNDGPLGALHSEAAQQPSGFTGRWFDLNSIGLNGAGYFLSFTSILLWLLGPVLFSKFYPPLTLAILGCCAWFCFRRLKLRPLACFLGALATLLNNNYFSVACWGVGPQAIAAGMSFAALGLVLDESDKLSARRWLKTALAGFAVGMGVMEAFDIGALYSMAFAAIALYYSLATGEKPLSQRLTLGVARVTVITLFAGFLAAQGVIGLFETQIKGVSGAVQDKESKAARWEWATQWSLPKREALGLVVPGLFGYRMDTPEGGCYWGACGRGAAWDRYFASGRQGPEPQDFIRYAGGGIYAGVLVALVGLWAISQSFRKQDSVFNLEQRKLLWFLTGTMVVCLLLAFGKHAPFYQFLYMLPYFSTIRNPAKFIHILSFALMIAFAFGVDGLDRRYISAAAMNGVKDLWAKVNRFDKRWVFGAFGVLGLCTVGWLVYAGSQTKLEGYLQTVQFDPDTAHAIAGFTIRQVGLFVLFLGAAVVLFTMIVSGRLSGRGVRFVGIVLGLFLVIDLGRANLPFVRFVDYIEKNATNPVIDFLRDKAYEHRVAILPVREPIFQQLYDIQWKQHQFQYWNVQSLDIVQMPRPPADLMQFEMSFHTVQHLPRRWELTNAKYLLGPAGALDVLNQQLDPGKNRFRIAQTFNVVHRPGVMNATRLEDLTAVVQPGGQYAVFEFTGALPRAKLYSNWEVNTNDNAVLERLTATNFEPSQTVLVSDAVPPPPAAASTNQAAAGTVEYASYAPKHFVLKAKADQPTILLVNDRFDPDRNWHVWVDGKQQPVLRCNFIMRGVQLPAGQHEVEFRFEPPVKPLYVSIVAILAGLAMVGILLTGAPPPAAAPAAPVSTDEEKPLKEPQARKPEKAAAEKAGAARV